MANVVEIYYEKSFVKLNLYKCIYSLIPNRLGSRVSVLEGLG